MDKNTVLSLSPNEDALESREATLRNGGLNVISVMSPVQARFEIEMGRCGVFLVCYRVSREQAEELTKLFHRSCPHGRVIFVTPPDEITPAPSGADAAVPETSAAEQVLKIVKQSPASGTLDEPSEQVRRGAA
jgi:DNA-binding NtrC family response regulator